MELKPYCSRGLQIGRGLGGRKVQQRSENRLAYQLIENGSARGIAGPPTSNSIGLLQSPGISRFTKLQDFTRLTVNRSKSIVLNPAGVHGKADSGDHAMISGLRCKQFHVRLESPNLAPLDSFTKLLPERVLVDHRILLKLQLIIRGDSNRDRAFR